MMTLVGEVVLGVFESILGNNFFTKAHHEGYEAHEKTKECMANPNLTVRFEVLAILVDFAAHCIKV